MKAKDLMTSPVITAEPETPVREIAARLLAHRISGLPILEEGRLVGIVSEADLPCMTRSLSISLSARNR